MLFVMGNKNVALIPLLGKLYLGNNSRKEKAKNYSLRDYREKSKCPFVGELLSKLFSS